MMPGETPPAAATAEAATACASCGALQQNLNEYVAALVALKQKIIDADHMLTEYQQKCNELQAAKRENSTLHQQVEQMFQEILPFKKCQEELCSVKAELEEKKSSLKIYQETHLEYARVKEEMDKSDAVKKKLETKVKKLEEAAAKHTQEFKQLKAEKKVLEKELKKAQEKIGGFPGTKQKKVLKNAETQSERETPVGSLDKEKIKLLLEELWMCIEGSTPESQINRNDFFLETIRNPPKFKKSQGKRAADSFPPETHTSQTSLTSLQIKLENSSARCDGPTESRAMETTEACNITLSKDQSLQHIAKTQLTASANLFNKDQKELDEIERDILLWFSPLPPLLSPIQFSPAASPDIFFGDITDSSDDDMSENAQMLESIIEQCDRKYAKSKVKKRHLEETSDFMEINTVSGKAACNTESSSENIVSTIGIKDGLLLPSLMSINLESQEETDNPVYIQEMLTGSILDVTEKSSAFTEEKEKKELSSTIVVDSPQDPKNGNQQNIEGLTGEQRRAGGIESICDSIQSESNSEEARCVDEELIEQNIAADELSTDKSDGQLMEKKMNVSNCQSLSGAEHQAEQGAKIPFIQSSKKEIIALDITTRSQYIEEIHSKTKMFNKQSEIEGNGSKAFLNVDALKPELNITLEAGSCKKSLCHVDEIIQIGNEHSIAFSVSTQNRDDNHLKTADSITEEPKSVNINEGLQEEQVMVQKAFTKLLQEETSCKSDPVISAQVFTHKSCLLLSGGVAKSKIVGVEKEIVPGSVSELESTENVGTESECLSKRDSVSNSCQTTEAFVEEDCLVSSRIEGKSNDSLKITEREAMQSVIVGEGEKPSALGTMCNEEVSLVSRNLQCGTDDTLQEISDWCAENNTSCLRNYATEEKEKNDDYSVTKKMVEHSKKEDPVPSEQNVSEAINTEIETFSTTAVVTVKSTTESMDVSPSKLEINLNHLSRGTQNFDSDSVALSSISASFPIRGKADYFDSPNTGEVLKGKVADANNFGEIYCKTLDWSSNNKKGEQSLVKDHSGNNSEACTSEFSSLSNITVPAGNKSIQSDEELVLGKTLEMVSRNSAVKQILEAAPRESDEPLRNDEKSEIVAETEMSKKVVVSSPVLDSEEESCLLRKVDCTKTPPRLAVAKDGFVLKKDSPAGALSSMNPNDAHKSSQIVEGALSIMSPTDAHKSSQIVEDASSKYGQSVVSDSESRADKVIAWEHSYAGSSTCCNENVSLEWEDPTATERSYERQTKQDTPPDASLPSQSLAYNKKCLSRKLFAKNQEDSSDIKHSGASIEISDTQSTSSKDKSGFVQERNFADSESSSDLEQSHLTSCQVGDDSNISHDKECKIKNKGTTFSVKTDLNSIPCELESFNSISEQQKLVSVKPDSGVLFASCMKSEAEQIPKPTDSINVSDVSNHDRPLQGTPSFTGRRKRRHTLLTETILADANTTAPTNHYAKTLTKIRQEMGPPLPPLLLPLLATPPRTVQPISPKMSLTSQSSLPSPHHELASPLCETPVPPSVSPMLDTPKCTSGATFTTPSPSEMSVSHRTLSSPLQFSSTTPKHALPVPGRFPLSAVGSGIPPLSQENSVKILDSMYPELSARARTLNILKGNIQLSRSSSLDNKNTPQLVHQISGFKTITSTSTAFVKTGTKIKSYPERPSSSMSKTGKRTLAPVGMPEGAKKPKLNNSSPNSELCKEELPARVSDADQQCPTEEEIASLGNVDATDSVGDCSSELLLSIEKADNPHSEAVTIALDKLSEGCFDLLPVIRSHVFVGNISKVPVMRDEEKEVVYELSVAKKYLAEPALQAILNKLKREKMSLSHNCIQSLCRVYVGICRQLGDLERGRLFCYSLLKEDFPKSDRLTLFIGSVWKEIFSSEGVINKAIQLVVRQRARGNIMHCLKSYLNWEESIPVDTGMMISSLLLAIQLCPQMEFQLSDQYGEDLKESTWEYVFAIDLLCSYQKWCWTHDNIISKELWPIMDKWVKNRKNNGNASSPSEIIVATVLRLIGRLGQIGLREGFSSAVENIGSVIAVFLQHAKEKDVAWGVQLAAAYALCDLSPSNPPKILEALQAWERVATNSLPPGLTNGIADVTSLVKCTRQKEEWSET